MKTAKHIALALLVFTLFFTACKKDDSPGSNTANLQSGQKWQVSYYYDSDKVETYKFSGYSFEFKDDGTLIASNSSGSTSGTWSINSSSNKFIISMGSMAPLDDLNDDWLINSQDNNNLKLKDDNTTKLEELHFSLL